MWHATSVRVLQEFNHDKETVRSLQIWMTPDRKGHTPQYGSNRYTETDRHNKLLLILGGSKEVPSWNGIAPGKGIKLHQVINSRLLPRLEHLQTCASTHNMQALVTLGASALQRKTVNSAWPS